MSKRKTILRISAFASLTALVALAFSLSKAGTSFFRLKASASGPQINFSASRNKFYCASGVASGSATAQSVAGTALSFAYTDFSNPGDTAWQGVAANGYFTNVDPIHGLSAIGLQLASGSLKIYYSASTSFSETDSYTYTTSMATFAFASTYPNYLKVVALEDSVITSVSLGFDCSEHHILGSSFSLGKYPQTVVEDTDLIMALDLASDSDSDGYLEYGSDEYLKATASPYASSYQSATRTTTFASGMAYYFKVEPIQWRVLSGVGTSSGLLLAPKILDKGSVFCTYNANRTINSAKVYRNNYQYSSLRAYLNGLDGSTYSAGNYAGVGFLNKAFTSTEQNAIVSASVDNSAATTDNNTNVYASENTTDKIFALSYQDLRNTAYGFSGDSSADSTRQAPVSDYARAVGAYMFTGYYYGMGEWLTRPPLSSGGYGASVSTIGSSGAFSSIDSGSTSCDILPAFRVNIA